MKKSGFARRALSMLLVLIMVFQLIPVSVSAGEINTIASGTDAGTTGVKTETLNKEGTINWPVKIYDYLNDGLLFEYANVLSENISDSTSSAQSGGACYGGGDAVLYTEYGMDFTCDPAYSDEGWESYESGETGDSYTVTAKDAVDYVSPRYVNLVKKTAYQNSNFCVGSGYSCSLDDIRYMTLVYRGSGISDDTMSVLLGSNWYRTPNTTTLPDSSDWTYVVLDLEEMMGSNASSVGTVYSMWITWGAYSSTYEKYEGLNDGSSIDITHAAFFSDEVSANNYGDAALSFNANPGQYLNHSATITLPATTYPAAAKPDALLSLRNHYKTENDTTSSTLIENDGNYGMDLTTSSTANGHYSTGYNTDSYWTWASGTTLTLPYGSATNTDTYPMTAMTVENRTEVGGQSYVRLSNSSNSRILLSKLREEASGHADAPAIGDVNYMVLVYRANGMDAGTQYGLWAQGAQDSSTFYFAGLATASGWTTSSVVTPLAFSVSYGAWSYAVIDLKHTLGASDSDMYKINYLKRVGMFLPAMGTGESLDLAYVAYFGTDDEAAKFGVDAAAYMNSGITVASQNVTLSSDRGWNAGNNQAFGMLFASCGGHWGDYSSGERSDTTAGGFNTDPNGYYSYMIGYNTTKSTSSIFNTYRQDFDGAPYTETGNSNQIYYLYPDSGYDTSSLDFDGYDLKEIVTDGLFTAGLLEGTLTADRLPVYRQETVEYIAQTLYNALAIPQTDINGNYNYNFVKGSASTQFGGYDLNGDGVVGMADLDGDGRAETNEASVDLATALRACLNLKFTYGQNKGSYMSRTDKAYGKGSYADTLTRASGLKGTFAECRGNIQTCVDAAYFLLNNIFVDNSYNQLQDDFGYLTLSGATLDDGNFAYVFDAGFTTGIQGEETDADYATKSQAAIKYAPYAQQIDGETVYGDGTISLHNVNSKDKWWYGQYTTTTRFPFLPIYDNEGDYADDSTTYYFCDDGVRSYTADFGTYQDRNYNYVLASNGEFVYREEDGLFFEFEGDDDVYLFLNGQIVLDIGGAHSITSVGIKVDDYVAAARDAMEPLKAFGYYAGMPDSTFEDLIDSATKSDGSKYTDEEKTMLKRQHRLNLVEGQICQFDFYYMERHGYGANMRIVTNMHVTDSKLGVEKSAHQYGEEIEYGGIVDPASPAEYNFKLTNTGNMKLYNLTFSDETIGVDLSYETGLTVDANMNGLYTLDANGESLEASDLTAVVTGWKPVTNGKYAKNNATGEYELVGSGKSGTHDYVEVEVSFADNDALIQFLKTLEAEGMESSTTTEEITQAGSGLWVDASVRFKGIHYILTPEQVEAGLINNTVYVTATNKSDPYAAGCETLRSDASHRAYTSGAPVYLQWADNELFLKVSEIMEDAYSEAETEDTQLNQYYEFFTKVVDVVDDVPTADPSKIHTCLTDKYGRTLDYDEVEAVTNGYLVDYKDPGNHNFYLLMYLDEDNGGYPSGTTIDEIQADMKENEKTGCYAIVRITVFTADVEDSYYVLDYGLKTESLDAGGELFKNDYLFGDSGAMEAKLMGVTTTMPSYLAYSSSSTKYNRIDFTPADLSKDTSLAPYAEDNDPDGEFNVNLAIPETGKPITYDAYTGQYSLTGSGTVNINAVVPSNDNWKKVCLYYWYDNGTNNGWPGTEMEFIASTGNYQLAIPGDVTHVIINNGSTALQTSDLTVIPGVESTITVTVDDTNKVSATVTSAVQTAKLHVSVPSDWDEAYIHYWNDSQSNQTTWPGTKLAEKDANGNYVITVPSDTSWVCVNNGDGNGKQTYDLDINAGQEAWVVVNTAAANVGEDGISRYDASILYSQNMYTVKATVPSSWGTDVSLYYWYSGSTNRPVSWPGIKMTKGSDGAYTLNVPEGVSNIIITDGTNQTVDLTVYSGLETTIAVKDETVEAQGMQKHTASITYGEESNPAGLNFKPTDFMDGYNSLWLAVTVHTTGFTPTALGNEIDINNEVQMFKKVTVLPANVVYYEDDFADIEYTVDGTVNKFETLEVSGSKILSQSVDQTQNYGQDDTYRESSNAQYSGESLKKILIGASDPTAELKDVAKFTFTGTGFELISRTNAVDSASFVVRVYDKATYDAGGDPSRVIPVITQFDNGNQGGTEEIHQVPAIRVDMEDKGTYVVEVTGNPTYDFTDWENPKYVTTYLYVDGLRIFQPLGTTDPHYIDTEDGASFTEIRDQIAGGSVGVATVTDDQLTVSSGTTTWTEDLIADEGVEVYKGEQVDSTDSYLIQGPNNEAYMVGGTVDSALVMYVSERTDSDVHDLQIAIRGLDYGKFNGQDAQGVYARLQVGIKTTSGYAWKTLTNVVSGTEQYYTIPYTECPVDSDGNYQVVLRTVGANDDEAAMASYTSMKTIGLNVEKIDGIGEASILYYANGLLVSPDYYLFGSIDGTTISGSAAANADYLFVDNELTVTFEKTSTVAIKRVMNKVTDLYMINGAGDTSATSATMYDTDDLTGTMGYLTVPAGHTVTLKLKQTNNSSLTLGYELTHEWGEGTVTKAATCTAEGVKTYKCKLCTATKTEPIPMTDHTYVDGSCSVCGVQDPSAASRIIYFRNNPGWTTVNIYTWTTVNNVATEYTGTWPGSAMTLVDGETDLYSYEVPAGAVNVIFNDGTNKTGDLVLPTDGADMYFQAEDRWITYDPDCAHSTYSSSYYCTACGETCVHTYVGGLCSSCGKSDPTASGYYLVGYINGADYGCEGDYQNLGEYKLVDGTLVTSFEQDSYVFIKTGDNNSWYMTQSYVSGSTGTFYLTSTGSSEKMFVPGGVEITFTLKANADGSLTLSYTTASAVMETSLALDLYSIEKQMSATTVIGEDGTVETDTVVEPTLTLSYPSLSFEDEIRYNVYFTASGLEDVVEMGLLTFTEKLTDGTVADAEQIISGYTASGSGYVSSTGGIPAKNMGDTQYFKVYAKLSDGTYAYSNIAGYNAVAYANTVLSGSDETAKALVVAMLNYGAAAQEYFGYNTDALMNASLTDEQKAFAYDESLIADVVKADSGKLGDFTLTEGAFTQAYPSVSFEGAFSINYFFTPAKSVDDGMTLYYWDAETYASASELTAENASGVISMSSDSVYSGSVSGIAAKQIDETVYVSAVYTSGGETCCTGVIAYSLGSYFKTVAANDGSDAQTLAQAAAIYGSCAKDYFA